MALNIPGLIVMGIFYLVILCTGIWASVRSKKEEKKCTGDGMEITLLAGRNINQLVGVFTLTGNAVAKIGGKCTNCYCLMADWRVFILKKSLSFCAFCPLNSHMGWWRLHPWHS